MLYSLTTLSNRRNGRGSATDNSIYLAPVVDAALGTLKMAILLKSSLLSICRQDPFGNRS